MHFRIFAVSAAFVALCAGSASAQSVKLEFKDGRVTLVAQNVLPRVILSEWARLGGTRIVNGDRVPGGPVSLELTGVPERQALDIVLRGVAGYMIGAREVPGTGASAFDRIMILPTSTAPRTTAAPTFATQQPQAQFGGNDDDVDEDANEEAQVAPGPRRVGPNVPPGAVVTPPFVVRPAPQTPATQTFTNPPQPQVVGSPQLPGIQGSQQPATTPQPANPFAPTPVPQQQQQPQQGRPANQPER